MSDSLRPLGLQSTRLLHPWDFPGKSTAVGCHFLLQYVKVKSESEVAQSCPTPSNSKDCRPPGSSIQGNFQARVLEWGATAFSTRIYYSTIKEMEFCHLWQHAWTFRFLCLVKWVKHRKTSILDLSHVCNMKATENRAVVTKRQRGREPGKM